MLSLDIAGAFDNVSHQRLLHVLQQKGLPEWLIRFVRDFLTGRTTRIAYTVHISELLDIQAGIP